MSDKVIDVRGVIDRSARVATLKELAEQGKKKVKVVSTSQITQMISEAVDNVVARRALTLAEKERAQLVKESNDEFKRIAAERESERQGTTLLKTQIDELKRELDARTRELTETKASLENGTGLRERQRELEAEARDLARQGEDDRRTIEGLRKDAASLKDELKESRRENEKLRAFESEAAALRQSKAHAEDGARGDRKRVEELQKAHEEDVRTAAAQQERIKSLERRVEELGRDLAAAREAGASSNAMASLKSDLKALLQSQSQSQEIVKSQAEQLRQYERKIAALSEDLTKQRETSVPADAMAALIGQFAELKSTLERKADENAAAAGAMGSIEQLIAQKMDAIQKNIALKVENIAFKPQEAEAVATDVVLDRIFDHQQNLESNLGNVEVKQAEEGGIGDSLKRLKNMQKPG